MRTTTTLALAGLLLTTGLALLPSASADPLVCEYEDFDGKLDRSGRPTYVYACTGGRYLCGAGFSGAWVICYNPLGILV